MEKLKRYWKLYQLLRKKETKLISITENGKSDLAKAGDIMLKIKIVKEADPFNMLATSSTAGILATFDAIMV